MRTFQNGNSPLVCAAINNAAVENLDESNINGARLVSHREVCGHQVRGLKFLVVVNPPMPRIHS